LVSSVVTSGVGFGIGGSVFSFNAFKVRGSLLKGIVLIEAEVLGLSPIWCGWQSAD
jgi:hypothetical protein